MVHLFKWHSNTRNVIPPQDLLWSANKVEALKDVLVRFEDMLEQRVSVEAGQVANSAERPGPNLT